MNDSTPLIRQSDGRHIQEKGVAAVAPDGKNVFALTMGVNFELETDDLGTLTGSLGDTVVLDPFTQKVSLVTKPAFDLLYTIKGNL